MRRRVLLGVAAACLGSTAAAAVAVWSFGSDGARVDQYEQLATELRDSCERVNSDVVGCVQSVLVDAVLVDGMTVTDATLTLGRLVVDGAARIGFACHDSLHELGEELALAGHSPDTVIEPDTYGCYGAVWHGFFQGLGSVLGDGAYATATRSLCGSLADQPEVLQFDCLHGVGHGIGMQPGTDVEAAMLACAAAVGTDVYTARDPVRDCATGVMSSFVSRAVIVGYGPDAGPEFEQGASQQVCPSLDDALSKDVCFERIASVWVAEPGTSTPDIVARCAAAGDFAGSCAYGFGRIGMPTDVPECEAFGEFAGECYRGAVETQSLVVIASGSSPDVCVYASSRWRAVCDQHLADALEFELGWDWVLTQAAQRSVQ